MGLRGRSEPMTTELGSALRVFALGVLTVATVAHGAGFTDEERVAIVQYWNEPGRYATSSPPSVSQLGAWQVRLTPEASRWLWDYDRARGASKVPALRPLPKGADVAAWEKWVDAKVAWDRAQAWTAAIEANRGLGLTTPPNPGPSPKHPGTAPKALVAHVGEPPLFAGIAVPTLHSVVYHDGFALAYSDNVNMRPRYAYYRFPEGVMSGGTPVRSMDPKELDSLFAEAGVPAADQRIMKAVSLLEGGFDAVNTYDTGFVSIGFIQFACLKEGGGSLGALLLRQKSDAPEAYAEDFRRYGIDVDETGKLVAIDPATGVESVGHEASAKIIADKRLISVFQRAGQLSRPFRLAQIRTARQMYLPTDDLVTLTIGGKELVLKIGDVVRSEAGMATLMDRVVHTGSLEPFARVVTDIAKTHKLTKVEDLRRFERDIVAAVRHRKDYLADATLVQPGPAADPKRNFSPASRSGVRGGRG